MVRQVTTTDSDVVEKILILVSPTKEESRENIKTLFYKALDGYQNSVNNGVRNGAAKIEKANIIETDIKSALVFTFGAIKNKKRLQLELRKSIKKRVPKFKSRRFFNILNEVCEQYVTIHEDEDKMLRQIHRALDLCAK